MDLKSHDMRLQIDVCLSVEGYELAEAAAELSRLGVLDRGSIRPRGSLLTAAADRLPRSEDAQKLAGRLSDPDPLARSEVVLALGEWAGQDAVDSIVAVLRFDPDETVKLNAIAALGLIGGYESGSQLIQLAASSDNDDLRDAALTAVNELATGGASTDMDSVLASPSVSTIEGTGRPVRVRGGATTKADPNDSKSPSRENDVWINALSEIASSPESGNYLRHKAQLVLASIGS